MVQRKAPAVSPWLALILAVSSYEWVVAMISFVNRVQMKSC
jgi:hypothetical protein